MLCYNIDMFVDFSRFFNKGDVVAVALSGGKDSMCLFHLLSAQKNQLGIDVVAINVEHGIRGEQSLKDTAFVKEYCLKLGVPLLPYSVDAITHAQDNKLSLEQSARQLRYECFYDAITKGACTKIATAHHLSDNAESILFNLFRGSGSAGVGGIDENFNGQIVRPLLEVSKQEIDEYVAQNNLPFVTDQTNFDDDYTRNFIRLNIIPQIKKIFPDFEKSVSRFSQVIKADDEYLNDLASDLLKGDDDAYYVALPCPKPIFARACILAMKNFGITKDWEKTHIDGTFELTNKQNGASVDLPKNVVAVREYDKIVFYKKTDLATSQGFAFDFGEFLVGDTLVSIKKAQSPDLKSGLFIDFDKVDKNAVIRTPADGDVFTKFGGGTKKLCDYFTDVKIPKRLRAQIPVLALDSQVLAIFGVAVSNNVRVDQTTATIAQLI